MTTLRLSVTTGDDDDDAHQHPSNNIPGDNDGLRASTHLNTTTLVESAEFQMSTATTNMDAPIARTPPVLAHAEPMDEDKREDDVEVAKKTEDSSFTLLPHLPQEPSKRSTFLFVRRVWPVVS